MTHHYTVHLCFAPHGRPMGPKLDARIDWSVAWLGAGVLIRVVDPRPGARRKQKQSSLLLLDPSNKKGNLLQSKKRCPPGDPTTPPPKK